MLVQPIDVPLNNFQVFGVSSDHGFLPADDPLQELPSQFAAWEEIASSLPKLIVAGRLRRVVEGLPVLLGAADSGSAAGPADPAVQVRGLGVDVQRTAFVELLDPRRLELQALGAPDQPQGVRCHRVFLMGRSSSGGSSGGRDSGSGSVGCGGEAARASWLDLPSTKLSNVNKGLRLCSTSDCGAFGFGVEIKDSFGAADGSGVSVFSAGLAWLPISIDSCIVWLVSRSDSMF